VLVPLHLGGNHWALMAIDLRAKRFRYFDSLQPSKREAERHANVLWRWLCDEADRRGYCGLQSQPQMARRKVKASRSKGKRGAAWKLSGWTVEAVAAAPRQHNGYDCGVFMLMCARSIAVGAVSSNGLQIDAGSWRWSQADMLSIRQRILADLVA
jgi:sentrin-specific protease 1